MTNEFRTIENEVKSEVAKIEDAILLDYKKVIAILRAHFGGDHPVIADVKKLAGENTPAFNHITLNDPAPGMNTISTEPVTDPKPVDTIDGTGMPDSVSGS